MATQINHGYTNVIRIIHTNNSIPTQSILKLEGIVPRARLAVLEQRKMNLLIHAPDANKQ